MTHRYNSLEQEQHHFLQILDLIEQRLQSANHSAVQQQSLLISERSFFWENFHENAKEMDLHELYMRNLKENLDYETQQIQDLLRLRQEPFFARIDFSADDEPEHEVIYIGPRALFDPDACIAYINDWRSPIASMYYDFLCGPAFYDCPAGRITGSISLKRQYTIRNNRLTSMTDTSVTINDKLLVDILSQGADTVMHQIISSIQQEQNQIIRNDHAKHLIVSGVAGSGKTSVALHRAAYLMYQQRSNIKSESIVILSPNALFSDYISQVLPQLGEEQIWQTTFQDFAVTMLDHISVQSPQDHLEDLLDEGLSQLRLDVIKQKASLTFADALDQYCEAIDELYDEFDDLYLADDLFIPAKDMLKLYQQSTPSILRPFSRMKRIRALFEEREYTIRRDRIQRIADVLDAKSEPGTYLSRKELMHCARLVHERQVSQSRQVLYAMTDFSISLIYRRFLKAYFHKTADYDSGRFHNMWQHGQLANEDAAPLLYLMLRLGKIRPVTQMRHVIIDEAQDYTLLQYRLLSSLYPGARFTILGDASQLMNPTLPFDGLTAAQKVFSNGVKLTLPRCYRLPKPISIYADQLTGNHTPCLDREGEPVLEMRATTLVQQIEACSAYMSSKCEDGHKLCAIITRTARQALLLWQKLPKDLNAKLIRERDDTLHGLMVLPGYLAKGLEFDHVAVITDDQDTAFEYVAVTRAMSSLLVIHTGEKNE